MITHGIFSFFLAFFFTDGPIIQLKVLVKIIWKIIAVKIVPLRAIATIHLSSANPWLLPIMIVIIT